MKLLQKLKSLFRKTPEQFQGKDIEFAFESDGIDYYRFKGSGYAMYYERYAAAMDMIWAAQHHKISDEDFNLFLDTLDEYLNAGELVNAAQLSGNFRAIRKYAYNLPMLYTLASVWYFDMTEDPYTLDREYCEEKIEKWQKDKATLSFFLRTRIVDFMPFPNSSEENLKDFTRLSLETQLQMYERHLSNLSEIESASDTVQSLRRQMERLRRYLPLAS